MQTTKEAKKENNGINYHVFLSVLIHMTLLLFTSIREEAALGDKQIPIEIIDITSIASKGEYFQKPQEKVAPKIKESLNKEKESKEEVRKEYKDPNINQESKLKKEKENIINPQDSGINKDRGSEGNLNSNKAEKGSLKGTGIEKITCLSCIKPKYPKLALKRGYEGILKLKIWISKNGEVINFKLIKSSGYKILDKAGIDAAKNSKFYPLKKERTLNLEYNLKLNR